jgi:hypothetical protein
MPNPVKAILVAFLLLLAATATAVVTSLVIAVTAGPSIAAGERAALVAGGIDVGLGLIATVAFIVLNRALKPPWLILATLLFALGQFGVLALVFLMNLVVLNR